MQGIAKSFKTINKIFPTFFAHPVPGSTVYLPIGFKDAPLLDPFVNVYYFDIKIPQGFPDHPHIGMETVTYIFDGQYDYEDFHGHKGAMKTGHLQWMTAGKGLVHAERPDSSEKPARGMQFFMNLPLKDKFCEPGYQEFPQGKTPVTTKDGVTVNILAGEALGIKAPVNLRNPSLFLDIQLEPNSKFEQEIPKGFNAFAFVQKGKALFGAKKEAAGLYETVVFNKDDADHALLIETAEESARVFFASAQPCDESVFKFNSMILSSQEELDKAKDDYQNFRAGFADAKGWESEINKFLAEAAKKPQQNN